MYRRPTHKSTNVTTTFRSLQFPQLPNAFPDPILITHTNGDIFYANPAWEKLTGYTLDKVVGKNPKFLHSSKTPRRIYTKLWQALSEGKSFSTDQIHNKRPDGTEYHLLTTFFPIQQHGKNIFYVEAMRDITELQNVQNSLKDKDELLEQIINNLSGYAVCMLDKKGNIKSWNTGAQSLLGFTTEEVIGKHFSIFYPPQQADHKSQQALQIATDTGKFEEESLRLKKDGTLFWASAVLTSIRGKRGALKGFVKIIHDITSQKDLEISLRFRDQILADMAEGVSIIKLSDNKIIYVNLAFATMFGYERNELIGQDVAILNENGKHWPPPLRKTITQTLKTQHTWTGEVGNRKKDGTIFISQLTVSPISYYTIGSCWINVHQDITTKKELERQKDAFIGLASHELKTPLTALSAYAQLLEKRLGKDLTNQQYVKNITHQTNRLLSLVDDLLNVSRIDSGKLDLRLKPLDLNALTKKIMDDFNQTTTSHRCLLESSLDQKVLADKNRIEQVIINVLTNAVKYSPHADKVAVKLSADNTRAIVAIQDFGVGISKNNQQHLFERFYRTRDKQDGSVSGFGLGLYIAQQIVIEHGGQMWVKSQKGKGSTFYFTLPLHKS